MAQLDGLYVGALKRAYIENMKVRLFKCVPEFIWPE